MIQSIKLLTYYVKHVCCVIPEKVQQGNVQSFENAMKMPGNVIVSGKLPVIGSPLVQNKTIQR